MPELFQVGHCDHLDHLRGSNTWWGEARLGSTFWLLPWPRHPGDDNG